MFSEEDLLKAFTRWIEEDRAGNCTSKAEADKLSAEELAKDHLATIKRFHQESKEAHEVR